MFVFIRGRFLLVRILMKFLFREVFGLIFERINVVFNFRFDVCVCLIRFMVVWVVYKFVKDGWIGISIRLVFVMIDCDNFLLVWGGVLMIVWVKVVLFLFLVLKCLWRFVLVCCIIVKCVIGLSFMFFWCCDYCYVVFWGFVLI